MFPYIKFLSNTFQLKRVIIDSPDTHVVVISLCHYVTNLSLLDSIWFKTGTSNEKQFIPIHSLTSEYRSSICSLLPAIHAISGCDTISNFSRIGKKKHSRYLKKKLILLSFHCFLWNALPWLLLFSSFAIITRRTKQFQTSMNCHMKFLQKRMCLEIDSHHLWML